MANMVKIQDKLAILPSASGCYLMKDKTDTIIYVGKAKNLSKRVKQYFVGAHDFKTTKLVSNIDDFEFIVTHSEKEALLLEINLIKKYTPAYNIMFMDDKTYPYLQLTKEKAPILKVVRRIKDKKSDYFGPFPDSHAAWETMKLLNQLYPLRKCKNLGKKECLYYHMNQCFAPCVKSIDDQIYHTIAQQIRKFLNGDTKEITQRLQKEMEEAANQLLFEKAQEKKVLLDAIAHVTSKQQIDFKDRKDRDVFGYYIKNEYIAIQGFFLRGGKLLERTFDVTPLYESEQEAIESYILQYYQQHPCPKEIIVPTTIDIENLSAILQVNIIQPKRGNKLKLLDMVMKNAKNAHEQKFELMKMKHEKRSYAMSQLQDIFHKPISNIEIYDNSHLFGKFNVSAMVVFKDGLPAKQEYRLYRLQGYKSDLDSMKEVIYRRYVRLLKENKKPCDLMIVDGGIQQVNAAIEILEQLHFQIEVCGLVKDEKHKTNQAIDRFGNPIAIAKDSPLFFLFTQMQDEVHRFAISYHRKLRNKALTKSILDEVEGIGDVRKKEIWKHFKTLKNLKEASVEEIAKIVPKAVAQNIYEMLHNPNNFEDCA